MNMPATFLISLPREIIYLIFQHLHQEQVVYSFLELNAEFACRVKYFLRGTFQFGRTPAETIAEYCLSKGLPSIGLNLSHLSIAYPHRLSTYVQTLQIHCPHLTTLRIRCHAPNDDIRLYLAYFLHRQLISLAFMYNGDIVGEQISRRLLQKCGEQPSQRSSTLSTLVLHLSSLDDLCLLKRYSESSYLPNGLYTIECIATGGWLTDGEDDLCVTSDRLHRQSIFSMTQCETKPYCLEYELRSDQTRNPLTVLICHEEEEYWVRSSILSTQRKQSGHTCATFTLERMDQQQFCIRPCYPRAKRLQVLGKRIVVSLCEKDDISSHRFALQQIA